MRIKREALPQVDWQSPEESNLGKFIRFSRELQKLSLREVAYMADISVANLSQIETGKRTHPSFWTVSKIFVVLGESLDRFWTADRRSFRDQIEANDFTKEEWFFKEVRENAKK